MSSEAQNTINKPFRVLKARKVKKQDIQKSASFFNYMKACRLIRISM